MSSSSATSLIDTMIALSLAAGREIMAIYNGPDISHALKADASPVTEADTRAEAVILQGLRASFPDIPVVAEEEAAAGHVPPTLDRFFLVDPLDGTREFIKRNGEFTVNIALIENGAPIAGVVHAPVLRKYWAGASGTAFAGMIEHDRPASRAPISTRPASEELTVVTSRSHLTSETTQWLERHSVEKFTACGSSLKFCLLAAGEADLYPRLGRTMEWDTAAGDAVLRAAGGIVSDLVGRPLRYNKRDQGSDVDFANGDFVAYGDPSLISRGVSAA